MVGFDNYFNVIKNLSWINDTNEDAIKDTVEKNNPAY